MAEYQITYWQEIPSLVNAREGRRNRASVELSQRFQAAIDEAAMRAGMTGTDDYIQQWRRSEWIDQEGTPEEVAGAVAAEIEQTFTPERIREILASYK
jgi:hypothetical protein